MGCLRHQKRRDSAQYKRHRISISLALKTASQPEPKYQTPNSCRPGRTFPSVQTPSPRCLEGWVFMGYRLLKRLFFNFSLQSSQYHFAIKVVSGWSGYGMKRMDIGIWGKERRTHHCSEAPPSNQHTRDETIPSRNRRHRIQPSRRS